ICFVTRTTASDMVAFRSKPAVSVSPRNRSISALTEAGTRTVTVAVFSSFRLSTPMTSSASAAAAPLCLNFAHSTLEWSRKAQVLGDHHVEFVAGPDFDRWWTVHPRAEHLLADATELSRRSGPRRLTRHRPLVGLVIAVCTVGSAAAEGCYLS